MEHEPTLTRKRKWGPVVLRCSCGWTSGETTQFAAWQLYENHRRPTMTFTGSRGDCAGRSLRARVT